MTEDLSEDLLYGGDAIALFLFGDRKHRRKVYHLVQTNQIPSFKYGATICSRRSMLLADIARREERAQKDRLAEPNRKHCDPC